MNRLKSTVIFTAILFLLTGILLLGAKAADEGEATIFTGLAEGEALDFATAWNQVHRLVLDGVTEGLEIRAEPVIISSGATTIRSWKGEVTPPWEYFWFFFIDDEPTANWEHNCRYVFVSPDASSIVVRQARTPVLLCGQGENIRDGRPLEVIVPYSRPEEAVPETPPGERGAKAIRYDGDPTKCYAVIISGGANSYNNHIRYWGDSAFIYSTLTRKYGYSDSHIYALISDGTNPAVDRSDGTNSPTDLDGDGDVDTDYSAIYANVSSVFSTLGGILTSGDQLFVFVTDHGGQDSGTTTYINLWNLESLYDYQLYDMVKNFPCPVMFVMEQCHSGGFIDNLNQSNRVIATATTYDKSSYAGTTSPNYDQWCYYWTAAVRGYLPGAYPWYDGAAVNADTNGDGYVSFKEASNYANAHKASGDDPQYQSNPSSLGDNLRLTATSGPVPPPPVTSRAALQLFAGDFTGNQYSDIGIFRNGLWSIRGVTRAYFGQSGDIPIPADFNGDGRSDLAVFRSGLWLVRGVTRFYFGQSGDVPIPASYHTGYLTAGIYRPSTSLWSWRGGGRTYFGRSGDIPVPGQYVSRDQKWGPTYHAIFRNGLWNVQGVTRFYYGGSGDTPVPGAYTTSSAEPWKAGIFRNGLWLIRGVTRAYFGQAGDTPVPADYIGYWGDEMAIFRSGLWSIRGGARIYFGQSGDTPVTR